MNSASVSLFFKILWGRLGVPFFSEFRQILNLWSRQPFALRRPCQSPIFKDIDVNSLPWFEHVEHVGCKREASHFPMDVVVFRFPPRLHFPLKTFEISCQWRGFRRRIRLFFRKCYWAPNLFLEGRGCYLINYAIRNFENRCCFIVLIFLELLSPVS